MTVVSSKKDESARTLTIVAEFRADVERVWRVWEDPRLLERWWGPPTWPATFLRHEFVAGGQSRYVMTGPGGEKSHGWWSIVSIDAPRRIELEDGFSDQDGRPITTEPMRMVVTFEESTGGTRMSVRTEFPSSTQMEQVIGMGMEEGMRLAMGQIDGLLEGADASHVR